MVTEVMSVRFPEEVAARLRAAAAVAAETASGLAQRLVDEGLRMSAHPGIVFRSGPGGRRAGLVRGPDVWEVVGLLRSLQARGDHAVAEAATWLDLSESEVRAALAYYGEFPDEVEAMIAANDEAAERARAAWERQQRLLA